MKALPLLCLAAVPAASAVLPGAPSMAPRALSAAPVALAARAASPSLAVVPAAAASPSISAAPAALAAASAGVSAEARAEAAVVFFATTPLDELMDGRSRNARPVKDADALPTVVARARQSLPGPVVVRRDPEGDYHALYPNSKPGKVVVFGPEGKRLGTRKVHTWDDSIRSALSVRNFANLVEMADGKGWSWVRRAGDMRRVPQAVRDARRATRNAVVFSIEIDDKLAYAVINEKRPGMASVFAADGRGMGRMRVETSLDPWQQEQAENFERRQNAHEDGAYADSMYRGHFGRHPIYGR